MTIEQGQSPLTEADPTSIQELFSRDPETLTDPEIERMVGELRKQRTNWLAAEAVKAGKAKVEKGVPLDKAAMEDLLRDL